MKTVRELIEEDVELDVYTDYNDDLAISFKGPIVLSTEGFDHFFKVLGLEVKIETNTSGYEYAIVLIKEHKSPEELNELLIEFFELCSSKQLLGTKTELLLENY